MRRKRMWILLGILLVVGSVLYLLISLPALARITSTVHTTVEDFNLGTFYRTGMTRQKDGEVTLLAIGIGGEWVTTDTVQGLPPVWGHAMVEHNDYVYVIGGRLTGTFELTTSVYYARINTQTYKLGAFAATTPLPSSVYTQGLYMHSAAVVGDYVYVMGGFPYKANTPTDTVMYAHFRSDGTLENWQMAPRLPEPRARVPAVASNGYIYLVGGQNQTGAGATKKVVYAQPASSGGFTAWSTATTDFDRASFGHMLAAYGGHLYVMGGYAPASLNVVPYVHYATPSTTTGDIESGWISTTVMPWPIYAGAGLAFNGELVALGGIRGVLGSPLGDAYAALLREDGSIEEYAPGHGWYQSPALNPDRFWHALATSRDRRYIYVIGGTGGKNLPLPLEGMFNRGATTGLGGQGYARSGRYTGPTIELGRDRKVLGFNWTAERPTAETALAIKYRIQPASGVWDAWSAPIMTTGTVGTLVTVSRLLSGTAVRFEYQAILSTTNVSHTPVLHRFELKYDVPEPPEFVKESNPPSGQIVTPTSQIAFTLRVVNVNDLSPLRDVIITDTFPSDLICLTCDSLLPTQGTATYDIATGIYWDVGTLAPLASAQLSFLAEVNQGTLEGTTLVNRARLRSYDLDRPESRLTTHPVMLTIPQITKQAAPPHGSSVSPGAQIAYTLTYTNTSPTVSLTNVNVVDTLPAGVSVASCSPACQQSGRLITWTVGTVAPNQAGQVGVAVVVGDQVVDGATLTNTASMNTAGISIPSNAVTHTVRVPYDLAIVKSDGVRTAEPGSVLVYTLTFSNIVPSGGITLTNVVITDQLLTPGLMAFLATPGWQTVSPDTRIRTIDALPPNTPRTITLSVKIADTPPAEPASVRNLALIGPTGQDQNLDNNQSTDSNVVSGPDLVLNNIQLPLRFFQNTPVRISADVVNEGVSPARVYNDAEIKERWLAVELYVKSVGFTPAGPPASPRDHSGGWCAIAVGETEPCPAGSWQLGNLAFITRTYPLSAGLQVEASFVHTFQQTGVYTLYMQADIANDDPLDPTYGRVLEADETNNVAFLGVIVVEPIKVYLPIVIKL